MDYFTYIRGLEYGMPNFNSPTNYESFGYNLNSDTNIPWPLDFTDKSTQFNLNKLITGVKNSIGSEADDEIKYYMLASLAPNEEQKKIINDIKDNEIVHGKIFRKIFTSLTGVVLPKNQNTNYNTEKENTNYVQQLTDSLFGELKAIEIYRELLAYAPNKNIYNMIMYILTDEIRHAIKYNYLLMLNK